MVEKYILAYNKRKKIKELSYLCSRIFNSYFLKINEKKNNFFFFQEGNKIFSGQIFKNLKTFDISYDPDKEKFLFILNTKQLNFIDNSNENNFLELWEYSKKNKLRRKSRFFLSKEEIWDLKWNDFSKKKRKKLIAICCGYKIKIIEISNFYPQFTTIFPYSAIIYLIDVFQWIISWSCCRLISGDIYGKLIFYKLKKNLFIEQIHKKAHCNSPISALKFFHKSNKKRFFISGGFDGSVKIWDLDNYIKPLIQINYLNLRIFTFNFIVEKFENLLIFVGLDNGFFSIFSLNQKFEIFYHFNNQGNIFGLEVKKNLMAIIGKDGSVNLIEFNSPFLLKKTSLFLFYLQKPIINSVSKFRNTINLYQSQKKKFSNVFLSLNLISKKNYFLISGNMTGVFNFFKLDFRQTI
jgi:WD40 repeat protein